jgi:hypothetical protein
MKAELKLAMREDFLTFAMFAFRQVHGTDCEGKEYVTYLCGRLQSFVEDLGTRLVVNMPPRHLKTFA